MGRSGGVPAKSLCPLLGRHDARHLGLPAAAVVLLLLLLLLESVATFPAWRAEMESGLSSLKQSFAIPSSVGQFLVTRSKRYAINPMGQKWEHYNITYKITQYPSTLYREDTARAIAIAFKMWSAVSPLTFTEVPPDSPADIRIGFYTFNHTDCWWSPLHPCFDGLNGELAHAFLPPRGEIHFDNHEFWVLGRSRFSWKQGVWMNDLVQVAAHEIGHALGLWHSRHPQALMHPNATHTGQRTISLDDVWGIQRLYGCVDKRRLCDPWARVGFCERRKAFMQKHCPRRCGLCHDTPDVLPTVKPTPSIIKTKLVPRGKVVSFRCGTQSKPTNRAPPKVSWYKDGELLSSSVPGYITVNSRDLRIVANEFNEGQYTCRVHRSGSIITSNSWIIRLKPEPSNS